MVEHADYSAVEGDDSEAACVLQDAVCGLANCSRCVGKVILRHPDRFGSVGVGQNGEASPDALFGWEHQFEHKLTHLDHPRCKGSNEQAIDARLGSSKVIEVGTRQHQGLGCFEGNDPAGPTVGVVHEGELTDKLARLNDTDRDHVPGRGGELHLKSALLHQIQAVATIAVVEHNLPATQHSRPQVRHHGITLVRSEHIEKR